MTLLKCLLSGGVLLGIGTYLVFQETNIFLQIMFGSIAIVGAMLLGTGVRIIIIVLSYKNKSKQGVK